MKVFCTAVVEDPRLQDNLCECIGILGGVPNKFGQVISIEYTGEKSKIDQFIKLFEHYSEHEIHTQF